MSQVTAQIVLVNFRKVSRHALARAPALFTHELAGIGGDLKLSLSGVKFSQGAWQKSMQTETAKSGLLGGCQRIRSEPQMRKLFLSPLLI
jgi:hypothetical protein